LHSLNSKLFYISLLMMGKVSDGHLMRTKLNMLFQYQKSWSLQKCSKWKILILNAYDFWKLQINCLTFILIIWLLVHLILNYFWDFPWKKTFGSIEYMICYEKIKSCFGFDIPELNWHMFIIGRKANEYLSTIIQ
jgi:hypothetical protein